MSNQVKNRFFYGYWIVLVGFIVCALYSGFSFYAYSVLNKPIGDDFNWSRSQVTAAFLVYSVTLAIASVGAGRLTDKHGPRRVLLIGTFVMALTLLLLSWTSALWNFLLLHLCLGIGAALMGPIAVSFNIASWFYRLRGTMQGIAFTGIGLGGVAVAPMLGNFLIPTVGWRGAYLVMGCLLLVIMLPFILFVVKDRPQQKGLSPYGWEADEVKDGSSPETEKESGLSFKESMATVTFWIIVLTAAFYGMGMTAAIHNQVSILTEQRFTAGEAVAAISAVAFFSAVGKLLFGYLCDRTDPKYAVAISYFLVAGSLMAMVQATSMVHVWVYAALIGVGMGGWAPNLAMLALSYFGLKHFGSVLGGFHLFFLGGEAFGPLIAGFFFDQTGSYRMILMVFMGLCLAAIPFIVSIRRPRLLR